MTLTADASGGLSVTYATTSGVLNLTFCSADTAINACTPSVASYLVTSSGSPAMPASPFTVGTGSTVWQVTPGASAALPSGTYRVDFYEQDTFFLTSGVFTFPALPVAPSPGPGPADVLQQVGLLPSGSCDLVADSDLNWGGAASGGWGRSWAAWAIPVTGGPVCTRILRFDPAVGHWISTSTAAGATPRARLAR